MATPPNILTMQQSLKLSVQFAADHVPADELPTRAQFRRWITLALEQKAAIVIRVVGIAEGRDLNHRYRGKNHATNVLTFVYDDTDPLSGDIVLCAPAINREALQQHKPLMAHYAHLTVHGVLHLQGYDHIEEFDALHMESRETEILAKLGIRDPYTLSGELTETS
ncbi:probable rRNA maturation factor [Nitrosomonas sp. Nm51]|uniref:rRNA maturation RNase YbeY n=1 Tax=Nitrosomonas sp. Nm51 TaxID=133720 RepID=UPI0008B155D7|nr:rRNA maturation RNase YbeY [Nitrosomonas sp. Nm51]SER63184.1 probable rRNA maturation factor [Nitrosomonas sp. Nm51]